SLKQGSTSVVGVVSYAGVTATFKAASNLTPNLPFTATISTGAKDLAGNALVNTYTWTFTTGASSDTAPPTVSSTIPSNGATKVPLGNALSATFSEAMNPLTLTNTTFTLKQGSTPIAGVVSYAGITATFKPSVNLTPSVLYTATISSVAEDLAGNALVSNYTWNFTSGALADTTPPTVTSTIPTNHLANVPVGSSLAATFSKAMDPLTITTVTFSLMQGTTPVAGVVSYAGVSATFRPLNALVANTSFTATISTGARDLAGNALATNYVWTFSTGGGADTVPPTVISTSPANGATFVTTTSDVSATFSEPMNPLTIGSGSVTLWQGQTSIPGTVTYAGITATFRPIANLAPNTLYSAIVTRTATDLSGNPLPSDTVWTFTTGLSTGQPPVCLVSFAILGGAAIIGNGTSTVTGDIGVSPGTTVSGFPPGTLSGAAHAGDLAAAQAIIELTAGYGDAVARSVGPVSIAGDLGGQTFTAGLYRSIASITISSGDLVLDAKGDMNAVFIFQVAGTLITTQGRQVILVNGAQAYNVFWQVGTSATLGADAFFKGSILADQNITLDEGANVEGRLLARTGTVTLQSSVVTSPPPVIASGSIFNAASSSRTVAAGSIASIFGNNFGSSLIAATMYPLPTELGGSGFLVGNQGAPLYMVSCGQANLQIPWEVSGQTSVPVSATVGGINSAAENATVAPFAPGIFTLNQEGSGQGAVEIAPTAVIATIAGPLGRPVKRGEYVAIFCTGLGPVSNQPATGAAALSSPLSMTLTQPVVTIGELVAHVSYSGLAPGFAGLYQVNAQVPAGVLSGSSITLAISMGGIASNTVTIAVE
ncbi:MAG: Ig-like domain-containing protein, partial [Bryobacteraceae bacterium]